MLKFWFGRNSPFPRLLEIVGLLFSFLILRREMKTWDVATALYVFLLLNVLFVFVCDQIRWYPKKERHLGMAVHFRKARVPTSYILAVTSLLYFGGVRYLSVVPAILCLLVVTSVNGILITFHLKDKDPLPINYFSANRYLHENRPR